MPHSITSWGSGCLFKIRNKNFVITRAHVITSENISCYCNEKNLEVKLIHKNSTYDSAYDVKNYTTDENKCMLATNIPEVGQHVYAAGYPLFKTLGMDGNFEPSVYSGRIVHYSKGLLITDCPVQYGQSGGPIYGRNGCLVAIIVSR